MRIVRTGAIASFLTTSAGPLVAGCNTPIDSEDPDDLGETEDAIIGGGQTDWAQQQGQRNTTMVSYYKENWWSYTDCGSRFGCQGIDLFLKIRVKPVAGANLDQKKIGVVYRKPGTSALTTVTGNYFTTWGNGDEEWHVKVSVRSWENIVSFNAWYQDGLGNTYFDDNNTELHAVAIGGSYPAITHMWNYTNVAVTASGVQGDISVRLADIDYDKQVAMVYTTDDWQTVQWMNMGNAANQWHWVEDNGDDYERWAVSVNIPGNFTKFQYAVVYRHGVQNGAALYEFWDNNGGTNWVVLRQ
ncbi:MAG: hypothetical protein IPK82_14055 [Polyangiaceae bacterium]|nr:hypothetical protein [Polyangiaceae bacterium]